MIVATVISSADHDEFSCDLCDLAYSDAHYEILLKNKKLAYFRIEEDDLSQAENPNIPQECVCHQCLYKILLEEAAGEKLKIKMVYFDVVSYGEVDPEGGDDFF